MFIPPKRVLVPIDVTEKSSEKVLEYALALASPFQAKVEVLYVWEPPTFVSPEITVAPTSFTLRDIQGFALQRAQGELNELCARLDTKQQITARHVEVGAVARTITERAKQAGVDLIVMGTHARSGLERLLLGSVATRVVSTASCPVLTFRPWSQMAES